MMTERKQGEEKKIYDDDARVHPRENVAKTRQSMYLIGSKIEKQTLQKEMCGVLGSAQVPARPIYLGVRFDANATVDGASSAESGLHVAHAESNATWALVCRSRMPSFTGGRRRIPMPRTPKRRQRAHASHTHWHTTMGTPATRVRILRGAHRSRTSRAATLPA